MKMDEGYLALHWNNHNMTFKNLLQFLRDQGLYTDVSLACKNKVFHAHKFVLSTCSDSFRDIFSQINSTSHSVIYMKDVLPSDLECILDFMYKGEAHIAKSDLGSLLRTAESLQVKGLAVPDNGSKTGELSPNPPRVKTESSTPPSNISRKNSVRRCSKRSASLETTSNMRHSQLKYPRREGSTFRKSNLDIKDPNILNSITAMSPSSLTEDLELFQIKKEIVPEYENNLQDGDEENGFDDGGMHSSTELDEYVKFEYMDEPYDGSNFSFENSELSTAELLQVDLNEDGEGFLLEDAALSEGAQALVSNAEERPEVQRKPFTCSMCPNTFTRRDNLANHIKTHLGERPFMCQYCKKCFTRKDYLKQHERIHTGEKPFQCSICGRAFTRKEGLTDHMRCHSDLKEFSCDICGKEFKQKCGLRFHRRNYHQ